MIWFTRFVILISMLAVSAGFSQSSDSVVVQYSTPVDAKKNFSILIGYNGFGNHFAEVGLAINEYGIYGLHPAGNAAYLSTEVKTDGSVMGLKIGKWFSAMGITFAGNVVAYTDFNRFSIGIRPELGFGLGNFKLVYGINLLAPDYGPEGVNIHQVNLSIAVGLYTIKKIHEWE